MIVENCFPVEMIRVEWNICIAGPYSLIWSTNYLILLRIVFWLQVEFLCLHVSSKVYSLNVYSVLGRVLNPTKHGYDLWFQETDTKGIYKGIYANEELTQIIWKEFKSNRGSWQRIVFGNCDHSRLHGIDIANDFSIECWLKYKHDEA